MASVSGSDAARGEGLRGRVHSLQVSDGGVPKRPVPRATIRRDGLQGDRQRDLRHHGGPERAVCLLALEVIEELARAGHPIAPGSTGENVTLSGLDWSRMGPGARLRFDGGVELLVTAWAQPCGIIAGSFRDGDVAPLDQERSPGWSRVYARVLREGALQAGAAVTLEPAGR